MANQFSKKLKEFTKDKEEVESAIKCWTEMIQSSHDKRYCAMLRRSIDKVIKQFEDKWKDTPELANMKQLDYDEIQNLHLGIRGLTKLCGYCFALCYRYGSYCWRCNNELYPALNRLCYETLRDILQDDTKVGDILMSEERTEPDSESQPEPKVLMNINSPETLTKDDLFRTLFLAAKERALDVSVMTIQQLETWEQELADIAFRAKAKLQGVTAAKKERVSKLHKDERDKLLTNPDLLVSDAISTVKKRKDRMSTIDKLVESMQKMNMSTEDIKAAIANVKVNESNQSLETEIRAKELNNPTSLRSAVPTVFNGIPESIDTCADCGADYKTKDGHKCPKEKPKQEKPKSFNPFAK